MVLHGTTCMDYDHEETQMSNHKKGSKFEDRYQHIEFVKIVWKYYKEICTTLKQIDKEETIK